MQNFSLKKNRTFFSSIINKNTAFIVLIGTFALTFLLYTVAQKAVEEKEKVIFEDNVDIAKHSVESHLKTYTTILNSAQGLFAGSDSVERPEWRSFVRSLQLKTNYPETSTLAYLEKVSQKDKAAFIESIKNDKSADKEGYPNFTIKPAGDRTDYFVIKYIEPFNEDALGYDDAAELNRRESMLYAEDTGEMSIGKTVVLVDTKNPGLHFTVPIYHKNLPTSTMSERKAAIKGWINLTIDTTRFFKDVQSRMPYGKKIDIEAFDQSQGTFFNDETRIFSTENSTSIHILKSNRQDKLSDLVTLHIAGRTWDLYVYTNQQLSDNWSRSVPLIILGTGTAIALLLTLIIYSLTNAEEKAVILAELMTEDLTKFKLAFEYAYNHIIITDPNGVILYANPAVEKITGYTPKEVIGKTPRLWGKQMDSTFYKYLWNRIKIDKKAFSGELTNRKKSGKLYLAIANIAPILDSKKNVVGFIGTEEDITEKRNAENQLKQYTEELESLNRIMVGREIKMVELKEKIKELKTNT